MTNIRCKIFLDIF